ncbi:ABC transporter permease [Streptomyces sp. NPDC056160]|uniref:ABC transporter permease n=1 Tax=Streptomyces sp. NPDC056160 TaxID=3345731 RepID=UPI0035DDE4D8
MTAPTAPTGPAPAAAGPHAGRPRLVRWLLRLHRPALYTWTVLVVVLAAGLVWLWGPLADAAASAWRQYDACGMSPRCSYDQDAILRYKDVYSYTTLALNALPLLVGAWAGGSLFGRELESGTARLAWAQGVTPTRWLATRLALPAALVTVGTGLLVLLHNRAWSAARGRVDTAKDWTDTWTLHANGPTTVALALAALAAGALAALLWRRTLPALATGLCVAAGLRGLAGLALPHMWPAVTRVTTLEQGYDGGGLQLGHGLVTATGAHIPDPGCGSPDPAVCAGTYAKLHATGFYTESQPFSHYWPLQLTTSALVLVLACLLAGAAFTVLRRTTRPAATAREEATA